MDIVKIQTVVSSLGDLVTNSCYTPVIHPYTITKIQNDLISISYDIRNEFPFLSQELFFIKDGLFLNGIINPTACGQAIEILRILQNAGNQEKKTAYGILSIQELFLFLKNCLKMVTMQMQQQMPL